MARLVAPGPDRYDPGHWLDPAPPTLANLFVCTVRGHAWTLYAFNHYTLQGDLICLRCSRIFTLDLASLTADIDETGSVEEMREFTHPVEHLIPDDDQIGQH